MRSNIVVLLLMITLAVLLSTCKPTPPSTVLQDISCSPPCWNKIIPGLTTEDEAVRIIMELSLSNRNLASPRSIINSDGSIYWYFQPSEGDEGATVTIENDVVSAVDFSPRKLTFEQAVSRFGEPDIVLAILEVGEISQVSIYLIYRTQGMALLNYYRGDEVEIRPEQTVKAVFYFDPERFEELMTNGVINRFDPAFLKGALQPWRGFGRYDYACEIYSCPRE